ncbi:sialidase family protein [Flagellimonas halotolerans]|uniref:exo-alpha-sialidase n=1 Tax=Flagellimonas halotolerans TaxID=3112164 RepID=A0ABU6IUL5_9FLAO|nr:MULTISPECIES: sialidase family protein [unclassified Allomuricauda]MEC3966944.1 sialidase family protein [Muricauda sp. SYSU M86414]MEC4266807.1 sialidase family protein [Muricauda sp. SYSU M84420]
MNMTNRIFKQIFMGLIVVVALSCSTNQNHAIKIKAEQPILPVLTGKDKNKVLEIELNVPKTPKDLNAKEFVFSLEGTTDIRDLAMATLFYGTEDDFENASVVGKTTDLAPRFSVNANQSLSQGVQYFWLSVSLNESPDLTGKIGVKLTNVTLSDGSQLGVGMEVAPRPQRLGIALRQKGQDGIDTYRIPGIATTNKGTLIAVYDNRYNDPVDLQEDIDVGMSRSTDGGQTWEPMKVIMDMGGFDGLPEDQNGIGDPAVLVDRRTNTIWVAALWLHGYPGERAWNASEPGMSPDKTGQLMLVKSEDDGLTWSSPINITKMTKQPEWQLFFNGPGAGITMENGTLVFPAQFKDAERVPHSTIIYSNDNGKSWQVGTGAKSETTEAQVVEVSQGVLMLNMRDDRNRANRKDSLNGRSVATSRDMGKTWIEHPTSRKALIEPNCMASIIAHEHPERGKLLFFSNPDSKTRRNHITVKTSFDLGMTWPEEHQIELYADDTYGYSCLSMIDENHLGILYEGTRELYFQKIPLSDLIGS